VKATVVYQLGDDISTDVIYPGRFMATVLPTETPQFAFADDLDFNTRLKLGKIAPGSVLLAGSNLGCGSSREQAASCLKGYGLIVVAQSIARIFLQNAVNLGLQAIVCPTIEGDVGDELDLLSDRIINVTQGKTFPVVPLAPARQALIDAGGLIPYARNRLLQKAGRA
jgi:3-isopropylmalate/(R)-2-methylmalate dehydratase small subunit